MSQGKAKPGDPKPLPRTIFRVIKNRENPYVMMDKRPLENRELSWGAKGLLSYMLSRPDDWQFNIEDLINRSKDGEYSLRALIRELRVAGHVHFAGRIALGGMQGTRAIWEVWEVPGTRPRSDNRDEQLPVDLVGHVVVSSSRLSRTTNKDSTNIDDEEETRRKLSLVSKMYEQNIGIITPLMSDFIRNAAIDYPESWFAPAFEIAVKNNARRWGYIEAILDSWKRNGFGWKPAITRGRNGKNEAVVPDPEHLTSDQLEEMRQYAKEQLRA